MAGFVTRFAPSPTGRLHLGHAYSALSAFEAAQAAGGRFLLRIEDIDAARSRPEFEAAIYQDLAWLGLGWEHPVRRQSEHLGDYQAALSQLRERGLLYRCFKTRREILDDIGRAPQDGAQAKGYRGDALSAREEARVLAQGRPFAWRLSLDRALAALDGAELGFVDEALDGRSRWIAADQSPEGDVILARKDVGVAYHLAVVIDDALQGVTHVIRGRDLFAATHIQRLLQALLGLPTPVYRHHRLMLDEGGVRLAKRRNSPSLAMLRDSGVTPEEVRARLSLPHTPLR